MDISDEKSIDQIEWMGGQPTSPDQMTAKRCSECNEIKSTTKFYKHPTYADGLMAWCKTCHKRRVYTPKSGYSYLIVYDPGKSWTKNSTLAMGEIKLLLADDNLYIGTQFLRSDGRIYEVHGKGEDGLCLKEVTT